MPDIAKAKRNVAKMVSMNAPGSDIDSYISSEGLTVDQIRNFSEQRAGYPIPNIPTVQAQKTQRAENFENTMRGQAQDVMGGFKEAGQAPFPMNLLKGANTAFEMGGLVPSAAVNLLKNRPDKLDQFVGNAAEGAMNLYGKGASALGQMGTFIPRAIATAAGFPEVEKEIGRTAGNAAMVGVPIAVGKGIKGFRESPKRNTTKGNVLIDQALPTVAKELTRPEDRARMKNYLGEEQRQNPVKVGNRDNSVVRQAAKDRIPNIKNKIYTEQDAVIQRNADVPLVGGVDAIANSIESLRNIFTENIDLLKDQSILAEAKKYRDMKQITLGPSREMQRALNANLQDLYKKSAESQVAAENAAKPIAEMEKAVDAIRDQISETLSSVEGAQAGKWYTDKSRDYGAAVRIEAAAERNITRAERPQVPFFNKASSMHSPYASRSNMFGGLIERSPIGKFSAPDALLTRGLNRYAKLPPPIGGLAKKK